MLQGVAAVRARRHDGRAKAMRAVRQDRQQYAQSLLRAFSGPIFVFAVPGGLHALRHTPAAHANEASDGCLAEDDVILLRTLLRILPPQV